MGLRSSTCYPRRRGGGTNEGGGCEGGGGNGVNMKGSHAGPPPEGVLQSLRWVNLVLGVGDVGVLSLMGYLVASLPSGCWGEAKLPSAVVVAVALIRIMSMFGTALAQMETTPTITNGMEERCDAVDAMVNHVIELAEKTLSSNLVFSLLFCEPARVGRSKPDRKI